MNLQIFTNFRSFWVLIATMFCLTLTSSCSTPDLTEEKQETNDSEEEISSIPAGFDFSTSRNVEITINDNSESAFYEVFAYSEDQTFMGYETFEDQSGQIVTEPVYRSDFLNQLLFSGVVLNGSFKQTVNLPNFYDKVYIKRNENFNISSSINTISNNQTQYTHQGLRNYGKNPIGGDVVDYLYCVNGSGQLFQVDPLTGGLTDLSNMPMGSWTCAIDQDSKSLYSIGKSSPHPLMKYDIETSTWEIVAELGIGGPRLDYNTVDGLLYFSKQDKLYTFDPSNGENLDIWTINGLDSTSGGDLAFAEDGTLFMCTFSGLYRLEMDTNNEYQATRISAENLPFQPTSMTFDSNQELWLANNASSSDLIIMDTVTGGWQYQYGISAGNGTDLGRTINDLTTFRVYSEVTNTTDTDGDNIRDLDDSYPNDPTKAFELFTPSKYGTGTLSFEDLWPSNGDYDFNDLAINYQFVTVLNAEGLAVQLDIVLNVKSIRGSYTNGFGLEFESLIPSNVAGVSGNILVHNYIDQNPNGTEMGQDNAVVILFDDPSLFLNNEQTISITFTNPVSTTLLGSAPFNPFMIVNMEREKEVHLPNGHTTDLGVKTFEISGVNQDIDGNYLSENGFPWAINIVHDFRVPKEGIPLHNAYNFFDQWATSGGLNYVDWYKDNAGYRNPELLQN